jgi:hypothetical protein
MAHTKSRKSSNTEQTEDSKASSPSSPKEGVAAANILEIRLGFVGGVLEQAFGMIAAEAAEQKKEKGEKPEELKDSESKPVTALIGGVEMTADEWGESIVTPTKEEEFKKTKEDSEPNEQKQEELKDSEPSEQMEEEAEKPPPKKTYPKVMGWALAELTEEEEVKQKRFEKAIRARLDADTAAAIAAEEAEEAGKRKTTDAATQTDADESKKKKMRADDFEQIVIPDSP